ncbi:transcriptional regulator, partial [Brevibacterium paucivorans]
MRMARDAYPHLKFDDNGEPCIPDDLTDAQAIELTADIFKVLATPSRLRILLALSHSPLTVSELVLLTNL